MFNRNQTNAGKFNALDFSGKVAAYLKNYPNEATEILAAHAALPDADQREIAQRLSGEAA
jgi:hypothetical protein